MTAEDDGTGRRGVGRRRLLGYLVAAPTLAVAVRLGVDSAAPGVAGAAGAVPVPSPDLPADIVDLEDTQNYAAKPTSHLIWLDVREDGTVHFALPRMEVGQGIVTSTAMIIAEEMGVPVHKVVVTLAKARPELALNQLTGGSNTTMSTYYPIRTAAAIARGALLEAAALMLGGIKPNLLEMDNGEVVAPDGARIPFGDLTGAAAVDETTAKEVELKDASQFNVIGTPHGRTDARDAVTGAKQFGMDLDVPGALPCMVCKAPTINGSVRSVRNAAEVRSMPGVTHVETISTGVAVRARTFGQCIDAIVALDIDWAPGLVGHDSDEDVLAELRKAELPLAVPELPAPAKTIDTSFTFAFASNAPLDPDCAVADVRGDSAEIWSGLKAPIVAQQEIAQALGLRMDRVTVNVVQAGGSFGRRLFHDGAMDAALASKAMGAPVRLMWHRADACRQGRVHPMATSRVRATVLGDQVLTYEQRHTSARTDFGHGYGDIITAAASKLPVADYTISQWIYVLTTGSHYEFGPTTSLLDELTDRRFNTGAMRNIYSPNVAVAREVTVDEIARTLGQDPYRFRRTFVRKDRLRAVLDKVAEVGDWGRSMPPHHGQGLGLHSEYHGHSACLVELDASPETVNRKVPKAVTGPRVTKVVFAVDVGQVINPKGLEAQIMGGIMDALALVLTSSVHLKDGNFLEASWDNYAYTRQWNTPFDVQIHIMEGTDEEPGGAGEFGVAAACAAVANAYWRATGAMPTEFPINHGSPLHFEPYPYVPSVPQSPTNGLDHVQ
ncbi:xanthine dehydrogenase family protein molybdopterin-binding subunit [Saccharopolyspora karakumensis]|uniref:Xanthine dehydrogenase family protein molybdopterin-binding subunit n=1 Tax=Saccharopolyspora karakumensis TaxID=2530386 RepID=A0A4R5BWL0_9PSEU|nr:molybdopterin cofactor-binding domain-containing protein [Saccharopolyspora karakumensis]TDD90605.1 xanthine dehydrogenase family protein molybdopterin-binding subunit [Saccharopolyspora karakumensis]